MAVCCANRSHGTIPMKTISLPCCFAALLVGALPSSAQYELGQVAITGDFVFQDEGFVDLLLFAGAPTINASGDVAAEAAIADFGVFNAIVSPTSGLGSPFGVVVRAGDVAPGAADLALFGEEVGGLFGTFGFMNLNDAGELAFQARLVTGSAPGAILVTDSNDSAIFGPTRGAGLSPSIVAREGDPIPGALHSAEYDDFQTPGSFFSLTLNDLGDVAFQVDLRTGSAPGSMPVTPDNDSAIVGPIAGPGSALGIVAREDDPAPGASDLAEFNAFSTGIQGFGGFGLNDAGDVAFVAELRTGSTPGATPVTYENGRAVFGPTAGPGSPLGIVARDGDPAPGAEDLALFSGFLLNYAALNNSGDVAFAAGLRSGTEPVAVPVTSDNETAIFGPTMGPGSPLGILARQGEPAPGAKDLALFDGPDPSSFFLDAVALNDAGDVAFVTNLRTGSGAPVTESNDRALFASFDGLLELVLREGDVVSVDSFGRPEDRTVERIFFGPNGLNDAGVIAVQLEFTDGSEGIFTLTPIPEPSAVPHVLLAVGLGFSRFSRTRPAPAA